VIAPGNPIADGAGPAAGTGHTIPVRGKERQHAIHRLLLRFIRVDGVTYEHAYGHTPLSIAEDIPWRCRRLVVGTGADSAAGYVGAREAGHISPYRIAEA
jgi:hypothetical protein